MHESKPYLEKKTTYLLVMSNTSDTSKQYLRRNERPTSVSSINVLQKFVNEMK